jgi:hypothetical protein
VPKAVRPLLIDLFFENVVSLMHMDSAGLTDTVAGNTWSIVNGGSISGTQTKFGAGAYNVPPSGRPYLKDVNSNFVVGTSDFTIELCVYINTVGSSYQYFYASLNSNTFIACVLNGKINIYFNGSWHDTGNATVTGAMWHTIAISRHNGTLYTFLDGFIGSNTYSYTGEVTSSNTCCFGSQPLGISYELNGYVDEFRFTKGIARYTTNNFPVASQAFTDGRDDAVDPYMGMIPYLAHYDSSVTQVNAGTCTVAVTGSLAISASYSKFGGSCLNFPNSGNNYITLSPYTNFNFNGDFTVECWINPGTHSSGQDYQAIFSHSSGGISSTQQEISIYWIASTNKIYLNVGHSNIASAGTHLIAAGTWGHVALTKQGSTYRVFVNGALDITGTYATNVSTSAFSTDIGRIWYYWPSAGTPYFNPFCGYIDEFRITNVCRYTKSFAVPTSAFASTFESGYDPYALRTVYNLPFDANVNSTVKGYNGTQSGGQLSAGQFGNCFEKLLGTDSITLPAGKQNALTNKEFTIDGWFYNPGVTNNTYIISCWRAGSTGTNAWEVHIDMFSKVNFIYTTDGSTNITLTTTAAHSLNTWHHFAVVRHATLGFAIFIDGILATSFTVSSNTIFTSTESCVLGLTANSSGGYGAGLKLDDIRLTVGACRYTTPFVPPVAANKTV